jgi:hypothetical protein
MPVATVTQTNEKFPLKTCEGGFVVIKRMTHGEKLTRQDLSSKMKIGVAGRKKDFTGEIDTSRKAISFWEFKNLILEHNLTDDTERPLNFKLDADIAALDGVIAEEIDSLISKYNNFEDDADDPETDLGN